MRQIFEPIDNVGGRRTPRVISGRDMNLSLLFQRRLRADSGLCRNPVGNHAAEFAFKPPNASQQGSLRAYTDHAGGLVGVRGSGSRMGFGFQNQPQLLIPPDRETTDRLVKRPRIGDLEETLVQELNALFGEIAHVISQGN
jgi:hypothetical protein